MLELNGNLFSLGQEEQERILELLALWRWSGGRCLSLHVGGFLPNMREEATWEQVRILGADRITKHVPAVSVAEFRERRNEVVASYIRQIRLLLENHVAIGIENMHMKQGDPHDERRGYGFRIPEWLAFVNELREKCQSDYIGCHLDLGHAYGNYPFHPQNTLDEWLAVGNKMINGLHIHQMNQERTADVPYPQGHAHVSGRTAGFPSLEPVFRFWQTSGLRIPLILEVRRGETDPLPSIRRMTAQLPF